MQHTGLPFVFGVCAVRNEFAHTHPGLVRAIHHELLHCVERGKASLTDICAVAAPRIPMETGACHRYLQGIEYNLGPKKKEALERFYTWLFDFGEASNACLPLKILKADE